MNISFSLTGTVMRIIREGNWLQDEPDGAANLALSTCRKFGNAYSWSCVLPIEQAISLAEYLQSVAEVWACIPRTERGRDKPSIPREAAEHINEQIGFAMEEHH